MDNVKPSILSSFLSILKACLIGLVVTLLGIVLFAIVLKFVDVSSNVIGYINDAIKAISLFVTVLIIKKANNGKLLLKSIVAGVIYAVLTFIIFSILNGQVVFNMSVLYDLLFSIITAIIVSVIVNLLNRKSA